MRQCIKFILFWSNTLHVLDGFSVHHQEFKTVHSATGICQTDTAVCLLASRQQYLFKKSLSSHQTPDDENTDGSWHICLFAFSHPTLLIARNIQSHSKLQIMYHWMMPRTFSQTGEWQNVQFTMGQFQHTYHSSHIHTGYLHEYIPYQNPQYSQMKLMSTY